MPELGVVIIGRNEGERLVRCIRSVTGVVVVYVDSGSSDQSVERARALGADVVALDPSVPFTAARARNAGFLRLLELSSEVGLVQFVDGDCEIAAGWLDTARRELGSQPSTAVVCGRRRERYPERSVYNRLCDLEWDTPVGETGACGGDALMRVAAVREAGGYSDHLIAGEEPELCSRLRGAGWKVVRLDAEMTAHDAAMTRFAQWWRRTVRAGYAFAAVSRLSGPGRVRIWVREFRSNWFWGLLLPLTAVTAAAVHSAAFLLLAGYPVLLARVYRGQRRRGAEPSAARLYAFFCVLAKFPLVQGQLRYYRDRLLGRTGRLIEYKGPEPQRVS